MKNRMRYLGLISLVAVSACDAQPTAPSRAATAMVPLHHNIRATDPQGRIWFVCETQPREYIAPSGQHTMERDHYLQEGPCPTIPIR